MLPKWHILFGFLFAYVVYWFTSITISQAILIFLSSVLIDIDHYLFYGYEMKTSNFKKIFSFAMKRHQKIRQMPFEEKKGYKFPQFFLHGIEFLIILAILSYFYNIFLLILLGVIFHISLDFLQIFYNKDPIHFKLSQIYLFIINKNKEDFK